MSDREVGGERQFYRCKLCLADPDKRISDSARFRLELADDYADILRHAISEHSGSDELADVLDLDFTTPCAECGEPFITPLRIVIDGMVARNFCDDCFGEADVERLIHRSVAVGEILPLVAPASKRCVDADREEQS